MKKYIILTAVAILALAACSKVTHNVEVPDQAITFQVVKYANSTKAGEVDYAENYADVPFGTFAFMNSYANENSNWDNAGTTDNVYMDNVLVSLQNGTWAPTPTYYWPKSAKLTFASYSPYKESGYGVPKYDKTAGYQFTNYKIEEYANVDLMVADIAKDKTYNEGPTYFYEGVPTLFRHLLTDLQFKFKRASYSNDNVDEEKSYITVTKVELINFIDTKSYSNEAWTANTAAGSTSFNITDGSLELKQNVVLPETPKDVIIMPQTLVNKIVPAEGETAPAFQALKVTYNIVTYFNGKENPVTESNVVSTVPFYFAGKAATETEEEQAAITEFKKNQKIVYTVTIFPYANNPILFDPAVVAWDETTGTLDLVNAD